MQTDATEGINTPTSEHTHAQINPSYKTLPCNETFDIMRLRSKNPSKLNLAIEQDLVYNTTSSSYSVRQLILLPKVAL